MFFLFRTKQTNHQQPKTRIEKGKDLRESLGLFHRARRTSFGGRHRSGAVHGSAASVGTGVPNKGGHVAARVSFGKGLRGDGVVSLGG